MAPTTLLPFLYQTRTLQIFARTRVATPALQAFFHNSPRQQLPRPARSTPGRKATRQTSKQSPEWTEEHVGAEEPTQPAAKEEPAKRVRKSAALASASYSGSVPFEGLLQFEEEDDPEVISRSTITIKERNAFDRIFEEIAMRNRVAASPEPVNNRIPGSTGMFLPDLFPPKDAKPNPNPYSELLQNEESFRNHVNVIVHDAANRAVEKGFHSRHHMLGSIKNVTDPEQALMRFPPSLRKAAKLALGVIDRDRQVDNYNNVTATIPAHIPPDLHGEMNDLNDMTNNPVSDKIVDESIRSTERRRVEAKMRAAKTDFELWDVLEAEVFPLVERLGISGESSAADGSNPVGGVSKRRIVKHRKAVKAVSEDGAQVTTSASGGFESGQDGTLSMNIYGPLYPAYLLLALRMLDQSFSQSSPMVLNLLPRIKELGLMSFVLGVSSPFYNTLASILWYRYGDAAAVLDLLEEMRHVGLYCDTYTQGILYRIQDYIRTSRGGTHGPFLSEIVDGSDYTVRLRTRFTHWNLFIGQQLEEKAPELVPGLP